MKGTVNISREIWFDSAFRREPFSEREAFIWLIMESSWKPRTKRVGDLVAKTERGQAAVSIRFMADAWGWTAAKVQRYLKRIEKLNLVRRQTDTGLTLLTICKYDEYQSFPKDPDTGPIQDRYRTDTNENKGVIREQEGEIDGTPKHEAISQAVIAYNETAKTTGWPKVQKLSASRRSSLMARLKDGGGLPGWIRIINRAAASQFLTGQTDKPFFASFDWIVKQANFTKISEGNYDQRPNLKSINGIQNGQFTNDQDNRIQRIVRAAAAGTSGKDWG